MEALGSFKWVDLVAMKDGGLSSTTACTATISLGPVELFCGTPGGEFSGTGPAGLLLELPGWCDEASDGEPQTNSAAAHVCKPVELMVAWVRCWA